MTSLLDVWKLKIRKDAREHDLIEVALVAVFGVVTSGKCAHLFCPNDIGLFRRFGRHRFCCDEHEHEYFRELDRLAIERLRNARPAAKLSRKHNEITGECALTFRSRQVSGQAEQTLALIVPSAISAVLSSPA